MREFGLITTANCIVAITFISTCTGCTKGEAPGHSPHLRTSHNLIEANGYRFSAPSNWESSTVQDAELGNITLVKRVDSFATIWIAPRLEGDTPRDYADRMVSEFESQYDVDYEATPQRAFGRHFGYGNSLDFNLSGYSGRFSVFVIESHGRFTVVVFLSYQKDGSEIEAGFETIRSSLVTVAAD